MSRIFVTIAARQSAKILNYLDRSERSNFTAGWATGWRRFAAIAKRVKGRTMDAWELADSTTFLAVQRACMEVAEGIARKVKPAAPVAHRDPEDGGDAPLDPPIPGQETLT